MIVIIDHGSGNLRSIQWAFSRAGVEARISDEPAVIAEAQRLILPGVGAFGAAMDALRERNIRAVLEETVREKNTPLLGICLGFQMLHEASEEGGGPGLGWLKGVARRFPQQGQDPPLKVPHMGWNSIQRIRTDGILAKVPDDADFYFAHSYFVETQDTAAQAATSVYGQPFTAVVESGNIFGAQFHPEKSHMNGLRFIEAFLEQTAHA